MHTTKQSINDMASSELKRLKIINMTKHDTATFSESFVANLKGFTSDSGGLENISKFRIENSTKNVTNERSESDPRGQKTIKNLRGTYKRKGELKWLRKLNEGSYKRHKFQIILENYAGKPGDNIRVNELESFPILELRGKFGTTLTWDDNKRKPKEKYFEHKFKESISWSEDFERVNFKDTLQEACFKVLDMGRTRYFDMVRVVDMCNKFGFKYGVNYTAMVKNVYRGGNEEHHKCDCTFILFKSVRDATIGGYFLGGLASRNSFWKQWGSSPFIWDQFETPGGDDKTFFLKWEKPGIFVSKTQDALDKFYTTLKNYSMGDLRGGMFAAKWRYQNTLQHMGIKPMHVNYESLPGHYSTILDPRLVGNDCVLPNNERLQNFRAKVLNKDFVMHNQSRGPIKFWRSYNDTKAKEHVTKHNAIASRKNQKFADNQRVDKVRRINKNGLAEVSLSNKFLRPSDVNYLLHDSVVNAVQYELWGQFSQDELFIHTQLLTELKNPATMVKMSEGTTIEEYEEMVMLVSAGMSTSEPVMRLFHNMKQKTNEMNEERKRENRFIARVVERIGKNDSLEIARASKQNTLSNQFRTFFENYNLGNKVLGHSEQINNLSNMFDAIRSDDQSKYQTNKRLLDQETKSGFESQVKKLKMEDIIEGKPSCSTPKFSNENDRTFRNFFFQGKLDDEAMDESDKECDLKYSLDIISEPVSTTSSALSFAAGSDRYTEIIPTLEGDTEDDLFSRDSGSRAEGETMADIDFSSSLVLDSMERIRRSDLGGVDDIIEKLENISDHSSLNESNNISGNTSSDTSKEFENSKVSSETPKFKKPVSRPTIHLTKPLSEIIKEDEWKNIRSNKNREFFSNGSFALGMVDKFSWKMKMVADHKNQFKRQLVTAKGDRIRWQSFILGYSAFVSRIIYLLIENTLDGDDMKEELKALLRAVKLYQTANDDRAIFTTLKNSKKEDEFGDFGIKAVPVVSELVFNTILEASKFISDEISIRFVLPHGTSPFAKRILEIEKGRTQVTKRITEDKQANANITEKKRSEGMIIADRQYFFPGDEIQEQFELSNLNFQDISNATMDANISHDLQQSFSSPNQTSHAPDLTGFLENNLNRILELSSFTENSRVYPDLTQSNIQENEVLNVEYTQDSDFQSLLNPLMTPVLSSLVPTPFEQQFNDLARDPYKIINEKVNFKIGRHIFYNPQMPSDHEINLNLGDENLQLNLERVSPKKKFKKILPLAVAYANINPNVQIKLNKFVSAFPYTSFICASELRCKRTEITSSEVVPLAYKGFTHETDRIDERVHSCVIVRSCFRKDCSLIYSKSPFTIIKYKNNNSSIAIGAFYIPPADSKVWSEELNMNMLETRLSEVSKILSKIPCIIFADINVDKNNFRGTRDRIIWNLVSEKLGHLKRHKTTHTYTKSEEHNSTTIDYMWTRNIDNGTLKLFGGREYIGNDGHAVFEYCTKETVPGLIGTTRVNRRPKLEPEKVFKLGKLYYPDLKRKLDEIESRWKIRLGIPENELLFNKILNPNLESHSNNEYCELVFNFLEELFSTLQPDNFTEVNIYNNSKTYGSAVTRIVNVIGNLEKRKEKALTDGTDISLLERAIRRFNRLLDKYKNKDERKKWIGKHKINDLNIFEIAKLKRPKLRETATDREIFSSEQLASEFKRLYKTITEHVKNGGTSTIDITNLIPEISNEDKYSFEKWLPTWKQMPRGMAERKIKTIEQCFNSLKPVTRGLNSSLFRDCIKMLPAEYYPIIESMIIYWANFGNYPECFLTGKLKPILKKGDINLIKNRRFISVGNMFQQLLGKTIASSLLEFVEHMKILDDRQYGFRAGRSCELAVANLIYKAKSRLDNVVTRIIFLDLSSAFFCVKKKELLRVLGKFVRKDTLLCLEKMLLPRKAVVISDGIESDPFDVEDIGVPQGEACSPLFFILIINGIFKHVSNPETNIKGTDFQGFADDSQLELFSNIIKELEDLTEKGWKKTKEYVEAVGFKINPSKSEGIHFGPTEKVKKLGEFIRTSDGDIEVKKELKFLGLWIDNNLSFKPQYEHIIKKMKSVRAVVFDLIGMGTARQIIKVAISKAAGIYLYGLGIQPKWTDTQYKTLQTIIKDIIKCAYDVKFNGFKEVSQLKLLRKANWMPVKIQHGRAALMTLNRVIMNKRLINFQKIIKEHIFFENFDEFVPSENNVRIPIIVKDRYKNKGSKVGSAFPVSVKFWFDKLPDFIKIKLGTKEFRKMVTAYCRILYWHRKDDECRHCDDFNINEDLDSFTTYEKIIRALCIQNNLNESEVEEQMELETNTFLDLVEVFQDPDEMIEGMANLNVD